MKHLYIAATLLGIALLGLVLAQEYGDADFNELSAQGTTPLTLGNGSARDICINFNDDDRDDSLCFNETNERFLFDTDGLGVIATVPQNQFYCSGFSSTAACAAFSATYGTPDATDSVFGFYTLINGTGAVFHEMGSTSAGSSPVVRLHKNSFFTEMGYTGTTGAQFGFWTGGQGYYLDDDLYIDEAAPGGVFMKDSGAACFKCALAATQSYTVTNGTTDRAFDANEQRRRSFNYSIFVPSGTTDIFMVKLRADIRWDQISCITRGNSQDVTVQECDADGTNCANIANTVTCDTNQQTSTSFTDGTSTALEWVYLDLGTTGIGCTDVAITLWGTETTDELSDVVGTIIADLDALNILGTSTDRVISCASATCPSVTP